jgi:hypothetical protein
MEGETGGEKGGGEGEGEGVGRRKEGVGWEEREWEGRRGSG